MQYISPFAVIETLNGDVPGRKDILLAKKKMLAELELNGGDTVTIQGRELTKNEAISFFDSLLQTDRLAYHAAIAKDAVLLKFLQYNILEIGDVFDLFNETGLYNEAPFIDWISPYFYSSFSSFAEECLMGRNEPETPLFYTNPLEVNSFTAPMQRRRNEDGWRALFTNPRLMNALDEEKAWAGIEQIVRNDLDLLYAFDSTKGEEGLTYIEAVINPQYIDMLEQLPEDRFCLLRDEYAHLMMQCSVHIFNHISREEAAIVIGNAKGLAVSARGKEGIAEKEAEMYSVSRKNRVSPTRSIGSNWGVRSIFFILFIIFKVATCNQSSSNDYHFDNVPVIYSNPGDSPLFPSPQQFNLPETLPVKPLSPPVTLSTPAPRNTYVDSILRAFKLKDTIPH